MVRGLSRTAPDIAAAAWDKTMADDSGGYCTGPLHSEMEVTALLGTTDWIAMPRFAVSQANDVRPIGYKDTPHTSFFTCSLHISLHAYHTAWLKTSHSTCLWRVSFHLHVIHDLCSIVRWLLPRSVLLLFLSVVYLFSSTLYLYSARHSIFNVDTAEG